MKLDGVRVVDLGMFLPAPVLTQIMADHGADVIRVEPPGGEPSRAVGPFGADGVSLWFKATHRGKRSIVLDLRSAEGREHLLALADAADVVIEGYRPGVAARLGIDAATLRARNPRLIYCSLSAYGQTGPLGPLASHDMGAQAFTGLLGLNRRAADLPPNVPGAPVADMTSAMTALCAILMALYKRETTGSGDTIDGAMYDSLLAWLPHFAALAFADPATAVARAQQRINGLAFYNIYQARDGREIALTGPEPHYIRALLAALGREDLVASALSESPEDQARVIDALQRIFAQRDWADWRAFLEDIPASWAPVLDIVEVFDHPHAAARQMVITDAAGDRMTGTPIKFADEPAIPRSTAPLLDEHGPALREHGYAGGWPARDDG